MKRSLSTHRNFSFRKMSSKRANIELECFQETALYFTARYRLEKGVTEVGLPSPVYLDGKAPPALCGAGSVAWISIGDLSSANSTDPSYALVSRWLYNNISIIGS
jgi:hypothetical protein